MLKNVAKVIQVLSSIQHKSINVINYLKDFKFSNDKDHLNNELLKTFSLVIKKFSNKNISLTLTHGDFKIEHLYTFNNELEYVIDWENVGIRSIFFDLLNFFVPWFVKRSYDYFQLKNYIFKFIQNYNPNLLSYMSDKYDLYFSIFALERYIRLHNSRNINFNMSLAYQRYNQLFLKISKDLVYV
jgi:thiamine kinase-like enzyme